MRVNDFIKRQGQTGLATLTLDERAMQKLKEAELAMADDVADYCERHGIEWSLSGGSVLGAVRHDGFIPWDDDIDINMTREAWESFYAGFQEEYADKYWVFSPETCPEECDIAAVKIYKKGTLLRELTAPADARRGIFVDIFIIESVPDGLIPRLLHGLKCEGLRYICSCVRFYEQREHLSAVFAGNEEAMRGYRKRFSVGKLFSFAPARMWAALTNEANKKHSHEETGWLCIPTGGGRYFKELIARSDYFPMKKAKFEGREWNVPGNFDVYLGNLYGDWRKIPAPEEREQHVLLELDFGEDA